MNPCEAEFLKANLDWSLPDRTADGGTGIICDSRKRPCDMVR